MTTYTITFYRDSTNHLGVPLDLVAASIGDAAVSQYDDVETVERITRGGYVLQDMLAQGYPTSSMELYLGVRVTLEDTPLDPVPEQP